jgi:hypothetical protein
MLGETPEALSFLRNSQRKLKVIRKEEPRVLGDRVIERKSHHCLGELEMPPRDAGSVGKNGSSGLDFDASTILDRRVHMDIESRVGVGEPASTPLHLGTLTQNKALTWKGVKGFTATSLELLQRLNRACAHRPCILCDRTPYTPGPRVWGTVSEPEHP